MQSVLAVSGVGLDKAWRQFDRATGTRLRAWSVELLNAVVEAAYEHEVDAILFVGDLFDRVTARPSTVSDVRALLSGIDKAVVILPGADDWIGPGSPYDYLDWDAVDVVGSTVPMRLDALPSWSAAGITRPMGAPDAAALRTVRTTVFASPEVSPEGAALTSAHLVTNGEPFDATADTTYLPRLANPLGAAFGALIEETGDGISAVPLELGSSPVHTIDIDVSDCATTADLTSLLSTSARAREFVYVRLAGTVRQGVLIPGFSDWSQPAGVSVDSSALEYAEPASPASGADSADVQFMRAMAALGGLPTARHQATALGLLALAEDE